jgi:molybdate transport system ATP-binding protein
MLLVSHTLDEIAAIADDLLLLDAGRCTHFGDAREVFADPAGPLADRSDARALIDAVVRRSDPAQGVTIVAAGRAEMTLPWLDEQAGAPVRVQVFARDVTLAAKPPEAISTQNVLPARVAALRVRPDKLMLAALDTPAGALLSTITRQAAARLHLAPGAATFALVKATAFAPR